MKTKDDIIKPDLSDEMKQLMEKLRRNMNRALQQRIKEALERKR